MKTYETVVDAINDLKSRGYNLDLNIEFDLDPDDFEIVETH